jgi:hypothetical protein
VSPAVEAERVTGNGKASSPPVDNAKAALRGTVRAAEMVVCFMVYLLWRDDQRILRLAIRR